MSGAGTTIDGPHPAGLPDARLAKECRVTFGRTSGPGGQHRNNLPTGIEATAAERRSQSQNRHEAWRRLRLKLARKVRTAVSPKRYECSDLWRQRRQGTKLPVNPRHKDYAALLAEALDVVTARGFDVGGAAGALGVTMSQLARLVRHDRHAFAWLNEARTARGLPALK
ncbi:MAG: peptide chain release factor family protein [Planctomycetota bacterium]|jgi:hypothetical protein